jgi:hypothetical protein
MPKVAAGESGGIPDIILQRLAIYIESSSLQSRSSRRWSIRPVWSSRPARLLILWNIPVFSPVVRHLGSEPRITRWWSSPELRRSFRVFVVLIIFGVAVPQDHHRLA